MRTNNRIEVSFYDNSPDGYGGNVRTLTLLKTIKGRVDSIDEAYSYEQFGRFITDGIVVFSQDILDIDSQELFFNYNNRLYKILRNKTNKRQNAYIGEYYNANQS